MKLSSFLWEKLQEKQCEFKMFFDAFNKATTVVNNWLDLAKVGGKEITNGLESSMSKGANYKHKQLKV